MRRVVMISGKVCRPLPKSTRPNIRPLVLGIRFKILLLSMNDDLLKVILVNFHKHGNQVILVCQDDFF